MNSAQRGREQRRFRVALVATASAALAVVLLLLPVGPRAVREGISGPALVLAGVAGLISGILRVRRVRGAERVAWSLLVAAATAAIAGNLWGVAVGADPIHDQSLLSESAILLALVLSIAGLLTFPTARRRGAELVALVLDGVVAASAVAIVAWLLVYADLVAGRTSATSVFDVLAAAYPALDAALATVALLLMLRATAAQRLAFSLLGTGYLLYALGDLAFVVRLLEDSFAYGTLLDATWVVGYLAITLAAWTPTFEDPADEERSGYSASAGTWLLFGLLLVTVILQIVSNGGVQAIPLVVAWLVLVVAAGGRQVLLSTDNARLRRSLERRVAQQTQHLAALASENELILSSVADGIYGVDREGRLTFVNPAGAAALGWSVAALQGQLPHEAFVAEDDAGALDVLDDLRAIDGIRGGAPVGPGGDVGTGAPGSPSGTGLAARAPAT